MNTNIFRESVATTPREVTTLVNWSFDISDKIELKLKELGMTQKEFAKKMGKTETEVSRWLSGTHNFTLRTLAKISTVLDVNLITT